MFGLSLNVENGEAFGVLVKENTVGRTKINQATSGSQESVTA